MTSAHAPAESDPPGLLVVDDVAAHRALARAALAGAGWRVEEADGGDAALARLAAGGIALVLLDVHMPPPDGLAVARAVRGGAAGDPAVPILAYSSQPDVAAAALAAGMDGVLPKPITAADLAARVAPWWPLAEPPARRRLAEGFGRDELARLTDGFGAQLRDALARLDEPDAAERAHRIAGLAGTLGFAEVYEQWLPLADGGGDPAAARTAARRALQRIAAQPR